MQIELNRCTVCGGSDHTLSKILWPELIADWKLSTEEVNYIDIQQGYSCRKCNCNLRSMTLASAFMSLSDFAGTFTEFCSNPTSAPSGGVLEINSAGQLTPFLERIPGYRLVSYPEVDMQNMAAIGNETFEIVLHSDTLEHIPDPVQALRECLRVLKPGGQLLYTVPIIVGRLTRRRDGLSPSYHGDYKNPRADHLVVTEYGADAWCQLLEAGFAAASIFSLSYPHSLALIGKK